MVDWPEVGEGLTMVGAGVAVDSTPSSEKVFRMVDLMAIKRGCPYLQPERLLHYPKCCLTGSME